MAHKSTNLTSTFNADVEALWDAICDQAEKVMDPLGWMLFTITPWEETGGKSLGELAVAGDTEGMKVILDGLTKDVEAFLAAGGKATGDPLVHLHETPDSTDGQALDDDASDTIEDPNLDVPADADQVRA